MLFARKQMLIGFFGSILFLGCASQPIIHTEYIPITAKDTIVQIQTIPIEDSFIDSIKQWTLENLCKGTVEIDTNGIYVRATYRWKKALNDTAEKLQYYREQLEYTLHSLKERQVVEEKVSIENKSFLRRAIENYDIILLGIFVGTLVLTILRR